jgi:hypothetical protein
MPVFLFRNWSLLGDVRYVIDVLELIEPKTLQVGRRVLNKPRRFGQDQALAWSWCRLSWSRLDQDRPRQAAKILINHDLA